MHAASIVLAAKTHFDNRRQELNRATFNCCCYCWEGSNLSAACQSQGSLFLSRIFVVATRKPRIVQPASKKAKLDFLGFQTKYSLLLKAVYI